MRKKNLACIFIKINTNDAKRGYETDYEVNKIQVYISKFNENKIKELEDNIKKIKTSINKSNCISCQKCFTELKRMKNTQSKIKPIKFGKELGTTHCLRCKDFTDNIRLQEVEMTNKVLREKSNCVVCWSDISRFLKQKHNNNKI